MELPTDTLSLRYGMQVLLCAADGPRLGSDRDAVDLVGQALADRVELVVIPPERLDDGFFTLSTGIAGEIMQKFVNYGVRLAIVGDLTRQLEASSALRDLVYETNRGWQVWFLAHLGELDERLERLQAHSAGA
jgi:hypothetical protein